MPTKLKVLVGLFGVAILLSVLTQSWVSAGIQILLLLGVLKGNEGVRTLLIGAAFLGICGNIYALAMAAMIVAGNALPLVSVTVIAMIATGVLGIFECIFFIWCLRQPDVQSWMFKKTMGDLDLAT
jgi:hypothetical protein